MESRLDSGDRQWRRSRDQEDQVVGMGALHTVPSGSEGGSGPGLAPTGEAGNGAEVSKAEKNRAYQTWFEGAEDQVQENRQIEQGQAESKQDGQSRAEMYLRLQHRRHVPIAREGGGAGTGLQETIALRKRTRQQRTVTEKTGTSGAGEQPAHLKAQTWGLTENVSETGSGSRNPLRHRPEGFGQRVSIAVI